MAFIVRKAPVHLLKFIGELTANVRRTFLTHNVGNGEDSTMLTTFDREYMRNSIKHAQLNDRVVSTTVGLHFGASEVALGIGLALALGLGIGLGGGI